jgi:hypothetical protein
MTLGEVVQVAAAFVVVQGAFNWMTDSYAASRSGRLRPTAWHRWRWTRSTADKPRRRRENRLQ